MTLIITKQIKSMMNEIPRQKLCELIKRYDASLCHHPSRLEGLLRDVCGQYRREIAVLINAAKEGVATDLLSSQNIPTNILLTRLTKRLQDNFGLEQEAARWAVESWGLALGIISETDESSTVLKSQVQQSEKAESSTILEPPPVQPFNHQEAIFQTKTQYPTPTGTVSAVTQQNSPSNGITFEYADFWIRLGASFIDGLFLSIPNIIILFICFNNPDLTEEQAGYAFIQCILFTTLFNWLYSALFESSRWQGTLGKRCIGIIVTDLNGNRISFVRATGRYFGKAISTTIFCIGFLMMGWTEKQQTLHDIMAGCLVLKKS
jgi:uncharacterized RDD family membrane protein YckC